MSGVGAVRAVVSAAVLGAAGAARASGDSGTSSVGEMTITGAQFAMMLGGLGALVVVVWLLAKLMSR